MALLLIYNLGLGGNVKRPFSSIQETNAEIPIYVAVDRKYPRRLGY